jgi:hypothetical protein
MVLAPIYYTKLYIECVNLTTSAQKAPISRTQSGLSTKLCGVCSQIDFGQFFGDSQYWCACDKQHYHLGAMEDIRMKRDCAMCRLLSSIYDSSVSPLATGLFCTLLPIEGDWDGIKVCFAPQGAPKAVVERGCAQIIRQVVEHTASQENRKCELTFAGQPYDGLHGRLIESSQVDFELVKKWFQLCETSHGSECRQPGLTPREVRQIRLVDVRNGQIIDSTINERFVALSYIWGPWQQFCLKKDNHKHLKRAHDLKYDKMPTTIKDAFDVVDRLGERYIWIDRLSPR